MRKDPESLPDHFDIRGNRTRPELDGWHSARNTPLRTVEGIDLRAGSPARHEDYLHPSEWRDKLARGKVVNTRSNVAATSTIDLAGSDHHEQWMPWRLEDTITVFPGQHIRLLAFSGTNKDQGGRIPIPRGRFLFGGAKLRRVWGNEVG
jgi:hypothetical protein